jgi:hypothetical protein
MDKTTLVLYMACLVILPGIIGCAELTTPDPSKPSSHLLGLGPIEIGMTKDEIKSFWGEPDLIRDVAESGDKVSTQKEEWIYYGRASQLPVNYGYLAKALHLYFDGKNLTSYRYE